MNSKDSYNVLKQFTQTLVNNTINSGKTSDIALNVSFEEFKKHITEQSQHNQFLIEEYMKNHDIPRKEKEFEYNTYVTDKANLKNEWKKNKDINSLLNYLQFKTPENLLTSKDPIYTIYSS